MLVVDTSVILAVLLNEPSKATVIARTAGVELVAPASLPWEVGNALSALLERKRLSLEEARQALTGYDQIPLRVFDIRLEDAINIAAQRGIYAYDAYFIACAQQLPAALITLDGGLAVAARAVGVEVIEVTA